MQAPVLTRTTLTQIVGLALALGLIGSIAIGVAIRGHPTDHATSLNDSGVSSTRIARATHLFDIKLDQLDALQAATSRQVLVATRGRHMDSKLSQLDAVLERLGERPSPTAKAQFFEDKLARLEARR